MRHLRSGKVFFFLDRFSSLQQAGKRFRAFIAGVVRSVTIDIINFFVHALVLGGSDEQRVGASNELLLYKCRQCNIMRVIHPWKKCFKIAKIVTCPVCGLEVFFLIFKECGRTREKMILGTGAKSIGGLWPFFALVFFVSVLGPLLLPCCGA